MYANRTAYTLTVNIVFILVVLLAMQIGAHSRSMLTASKTVTIKAPEQAFAVWNQSGVRGRILVLFDNYPHMKGMRNYQDSPQLNQYNLIEYAIFKNIIRKIYLVVPENTWNEVLQQKEKRPIRNVPGKTKGLYLSSMSGVPLIATTPSSLGQLPEEVLVYINAELFDAGQVAELLKLNMIRSDVIIKYQGKS